MAINFHALQPQQEVKRPKVSFPIQSVSQCNCSRIFHTFVPQNRTLHVFSHSERWEKLGEEIGEESYFLRSSGVDSPLHKYLVSRRMN